MTVEEIYKEAKQSIGKTDKISMVEEDTIVLISLSYNLSWGKELRIYLSQNKDSVLGMSIIPIKNANMQMLKSLMADYDLHISDKGVILDTTDRNVFETIRSITQGVIAIDTIARGTKLYGNNRS